jgi:hypothetical protein
MELPGVAVPIAIIPVSAYPLRGFEYCACECACQTQTSPEDEWRLQPKARRPPGARVPGAMLAAARATERTGLARSQPEEL